MTGDQHGAGCNSDYLLLPGGHCKNDQHFSTDRSGWPQGLQGSPVTWGNIGHRFCGNSLGVGGIRQPIISYSRPFLFR